MRLIDADALLAIIEEEGEDLETVEFKLATIACINHIKEAPTVDAEPVRHGRWVKKDPHCAGLACLWNCSECGEESDDEGYRYCPNCGAKMEGGEDGK